MSDNDKSLEDFFAKKAKGKKGKGKSKFTTSDAITKQVGSFQKETDSRSKDQTGKKSSGVAPTPSNLVRISFILISSRKNCLRNRLFHNVDGVTCRLFRN